MTENRLLLYTARQFFLALLCLVLLLASLPAPQSVAAAEWKERTTRYTIVFFQPELTNTAEQLSTMVDPIFEQMAALHDYAPREPFKVRLHTTVESHAQSSDLAQTSYGQSAQASPAQRELSLAEPRLRNLTPEQLRNLLRRGFSQLMLHELARGQLPIGFLEGMAQYSEQPSPEVEVNTRLLDRARRERSLFSWADLNTPAHFIAQPEIASAQSYATAVFLLDRYGLAPWQRFLNALRSTPDYTVALAQAYAKPMTALESEWLDYLPEYFGGSYQLNHFARYDLTHIETHLQAGRYYEARDELEILAKFIAGAGRISKEADLRELAHKIVLGLEGDSILTQGRMQMASFQYATAYETFLQARQRYESINATTKITEAEQAITTASSGMTALNQLADAQRLLADFNYGDARAAALEASKTFATLGDEEHYRQSWIILQNLSTVQTRLAYILAILGLANVLWAFWRLRTRAYRRALPGVLQ